jgi:hypothetical protein
MPGAAPPADSSTPSPLVVGRYAECYLFGAVVANLFEWEVNPVFDYSNLTAHGDYWKVNVFLDAGWTGRARGYLTQLGSTYLVGALAQVGATGVYIPTALTFAGFSTLGSAGNAKVLFQAGCFMSNLRMAVPMAMFEQEINLIGSGNPTVPGSGSPG